METDNWDAWRFYLDVAQILATVALFIWVAITRGQKDNRSEMESMKQQQQNFDKRLTLVESNITAFPSKDDVHKLALQMSSVSSSMEAMTEQMKRFEHKQNMLIENELRGEKQ